MLSVRRALPLLLCFLSVILSACRNYEVVSVQSPEWPAKSSEINIGYFDASGSASRAANRNNLYESLSFSLREAEFRTREAQDVFALLSRNELPVNRLLTEPEVLRLSGLLPGRILLQGRIEEVLTQTLVEDRVQIQVNVNIYSLETGRRLGEIRVYGKDLENVTGSETLHISRLVAKRLREMTGARSAAGQAQPCPIGAGILVLQNEIDAEEQVQTEMRARFAWKRVRSDAELASHRPSKSVSLDTLTFGGAGPGKPGIHLHRVTLCAHEAPPAEYRARIRLASSEFVLHYHSIRNGYAGSEYA